MEGANQISPEAYVQQMRERMEQALRRVAQAVNDAPDGAWINASEWQVFHEFNDLRRDAYQLALQMRADAAPAPAPAPAPADADADADAAAASAFSPDRPGERQSPDQQGV